ncbi:hypothetical protein [Natrinema caseinilyticum]|uniref:hypothetical protein n=1 Tax=Natrinema caseinilyticum TaxID=2961570 RepID=UPI0020C47ABA|nr:hypothetical protein [Natrinema caseinilyticum]
MATLEKGPASTGKGVHTADHVVDSPFERWLARTGSDLPFDGQSESRRMRIEAIRSRPTADSFADVQTPVTW